MYSLNENALEKSAQSPKPLKSFGSGRKPLNLELEDDMFCYFVSRISSHVYFKVSQYWEVLISEPCLFSISAYYRENTVYYKV